MNIFEQYGIREVADCTLYAITLDKYDDEVYVPILYFDTLKVSTIEQTAEQTSARGGLGNPELITWDYGKEITLNLEDALYNPASQSLIWGGQFGIGKNKIWGKWTPKIFPTDEFGRPQYAKVEIWNGEGSPDMNEGWIEYICPCDYTTKYKRYVPNEPKNGITECSFITIENFGDFKYNGLILDHQETDKEYNELEDRHYYDLCNQTLGLRPRDPEAKLNTVEYVWLDCDVRLRSKSLDIYYAENVAVRYTSTINSNNKTIRVAREDMYSTPNIDKEDEAYIYGAGANIFYHNNKTQDDIVTNFSTENNEYYRELNAFSNTLNFYKNITWTVTNTDGIEVTHMTKILVGTFEIDDTKNDGYSDPVQDVLHPISEGIENVPYLDRVEKCRASKTFAINADRNLVMNQYREMQQYAQTPLTVFINPKTMKPYEPNTDHFHKRNGEIVRGNLTIIKQDEIYYKWTRSRAPEDMSLGYRIVVDAQHFPGTYRLVGETYSRSRKDFKDQRLQFEIPLCKMSSDTNLTLEAAGEPTTFNMTMKVLRKDDGTMMKLTQYYVDNRKCQDSHDIIPIDWRNKNPKCEEQEDVIETTYGNFNLEIISPFAYTPYSVPKDYTISIDGTKVEPYLQLDNTGMGDEYDLKNKTRLVVKRTFDKITINKTTGQEISREPQEQILTQDNADLAISVEY